MITAEASGHVATSLPLSLEAVRQFRAFQYNPVAFGMRSYPTQVQGFVPQPWYERLLKSAHMQASTADALTFSCLFLRAFSMLSAVVRSREKLKATCNIVPVISAFPVELLHTCSALAEITLEQLDC